MTCTPGSDRCFGPQVNPECRAFDFTLQFEDLFFVCLPTVVFLFLAPVNFLQLVRKPAVYSQRSKLLLASKLATFAALLVAQLVLLVLRIKDARFTTDASLPAEILGVLATGAALLLSAVSQQRSPRPSTILSLYLSLSTLLNVARTRTVWLLAPETPVATVIVVVLALTVLAVLLESIEDKKSLNPGAPEQHSGIWTRTSFTWLIPTLRAGYAKLISLEDLPDLDSKLKSQVLQEQLVTTLRKYDQRDRHALLRACLRSYLVPLLSAVIPRLCVTAFTFAQPFLINTTIIFISQESPDVNHGKGLVGAWALVYLGIAVSQSICSYQTFRFITRLRGGLLALVYQRSLETRVVDTGDITAITLMGTDIERIASGMKMFHAVWGALLDIIIACWLLERQLFLACLAPIILVLVFIGATSKISLQARTAQRLWIEKVQERLRVMSDFLGDIKTIKMLGLSPVVSTVTQNLRLDEIQTSKSFRKLLVATLLFSLTPINLAPVVTFAIYALISVFWTNDSLLTARAFTSLTLITLLTTPVVVFIQCLPMVVQCTSSFDRVQEYCNYASSSDSDADGETGPTDQQTESEVDLLIPELSTEPDHTLQIQTITLQNQSFGWSRDGTAFLKDIQLDIKRESFTAIIGPVGSGKSLLLNSLLGEMISISHTKKKERQSVTEPIAYCSQQPWLENGTIRQNIIAASAFDRDWYMEVTSSCGLDADLKQLEKGDQAHIGSKGLSLSGGQKQRIALARAVYARKGIVLLDDVFSGMDAHTSDMVANRLLGREGIFRKHHTTVVLATNSRKIMALADSIIVLKDGRIIEKGSPETLFQSDSSIGELELDLMDEQPDNKVVEDVTPTQHSQEIQDASYDATEVAEEADTKHTDIRRKQGEASVYTYYLSSSGWVSVGLYTVFVVLWILCIELSTIWLKWWSAANIKRPNENVGMYLGVYALLGVLGTVSACVTAWLAFISILSNSAAQLHSRLLQATLKATFRFFCATDSGELINRFSKDMEQVDMELPMALVNYTSTAVSCLAKIVILAIFSQYLGITIPFFGAFVYFLQLVYLQTSRQVRLLATEAQAPLFTHFNESVAGAATIRAFGWSSYHEQKSYHLIDRSQKPLYIQNCMQNWLGFVLELLVTILVVMLVGTIVTWRENFSAGSVGVSLVTVVGFSEVLVRLIRTWTMVEPSIGAVARIKWFVEETESERSLEKAPSIPTEWPQAGHLEFTDVVASYGLKPDSEPVLKKISMSVLPGQHVAICGRTGSGKTSLILSLLQMIDTVEGKITLDGIDLSEINCEDVRLRINVVPQDPFLMSGTVRFNIDPYMNATDDEIIHALKRVRLWTIVMDQGGLDKEMNTAAWSAGERQLLCFARAIARKSKILVLDEAMSNVDSETEAFMQEIIDSDFKHCTVLAVMHRLEHVRSYDKIALLGGGELLEYGDPDTLMAKDMRFAELYWMNAN